MVYYPNREPATVLKCKCIVLQWGEISMLGGGKSNLCEDHGWQKVLRKATIKDMLRVIRTNKTASLVRSNRYQNETLF